MLGFFYLSIIWTLSLQVTSTAVWRKQLHTQDRELPTFDWFSIPPSRQLVWHECYTTQIPPDSTQYALPLPPSPSRKPYCARLSLPLDYHNSSNSNKISLAVLKLSVAQGGPSHGTIIASIGGAGNSRVQEVQAVEAMGFFDTIDPDLEYDFLVFDQRGFGYTTPSAKCFGSKLQLKVWKQRMRDLGQISTSAGKESLLIQSAGAHARGDLCVESGNGKTDIMKYMTTAYAARDMLEILLLLEERGRGPLGAPSPSGTHVPKLQYLGFSYGTFLGLTFASLYPQLVSRMLLDGTVDAYDWVGKWQMAHLTDADVVWSTFYTDCFGANEYCPMWRDSDSEPKDIENRVQVLLDKLSKRPAYSISNGNLRMITKRDLRIAMFQATLTPTFAFANLADTMNELLQGNTNLTLEFPFEDDIPFSDDYDEDNRAGTNEDAGAALNCGDTEDISESSIDEFLQYLSALEKQSSIAAFYQAERRLRCLGWPKSLRPDAKSRFTGPFTSGNNSDNEHSNPILFLNNRLDSQTPIENAYKMAKGFPGSIVLEQNAKGHCAFGNSIPSWCTISHVRNYIRNGSLPKPGTICEADCNPLNGTCFAASGRWSFGAL
ncbi:hypothetical protein B7494_g4025 [Chlorociboria aeruginascens]|nr:hypothetical protein B7494_g4025 [Chlorociboria aeruginascens]